MSRSEIGERVRLALKRAGMTQVQFAKIAGTSNGYVSEICRGLKNPSVAVLQALVAETGVDAAWLLLGDEVQLTRTAPDIHEKLDQVLRVTGSSGRDRVLGYLEAILEQAGASAGRRTA